MRVNVAPPSVIQWKSTVEVCSHYDFIFFFNSNQSYLTLTSIQPFNGGIMDNRLIDVNSLSYFVCTSFIVKKIK